MDMKKILQAMDGAASKPVEGVDSMARFLRVVNETNINQKEAVGDFSADPKQQAKMYVQFHNGEFNPSTMPKFMAITPNLQLAVQPPVNSNGSHETVLANLSAANKRLPKELQLSWDELKDLGGVSDTIALTGEPHPDKYNPTTDPTNANPVATPFKVNESKSPLNRLTTAESMAMNHYTPGAARTTITSPVLNVAKDAKPSMIGKYFKSVETEFAESAARHKDRARQLAERVIERVSVTEAPIAATDDPNNPEIYGHEKANPMTLKGRIMSARAQLKELAELADSDDLVSWERITQLHKGGMFMGLAQNLEQIRHGIEELAAKRKRGGVASRGIDKGIGEDKDPCWDSHKMVGTKKKGGKTVPNCVPK
jgi:hypothetical protein